MVRVATVENVEYSFATAEDAPRLVAFHNLCYGAARTVRHWAWEYNAYDPRESVFAVAKCQDEIIATQGVLPIDMTIGGKLVRSGKFENTLCLPTYRGSGVMRTLVDYAVSSCAARGMRVIWALTPAVKAYLGFGFMPYANLEVLLRPGRVWVGLASRMRRRQPIRGLASATKYLAGLIGHPGLRDYRKAASAAAHQVTRTTTSEEDLKELGEKLDLKYGKAFRIRYSEKYLRWRVRQHPFLRYEEYQVYQGGSMLGCAFVVWNRGVLSISDILCADAEATSALLSAILEDHQEKTGEFRCLVNTNDPFTRDILGPLRECGFRADSKTSKLWNLMMRNLCEADNLPDANTWHVTGLWTEGFDY